MPLECTRAPEVAGETQGRAGTCHDMTFFPPNTRRIAKAFPGLLAWSLLLVADFAYPNRKFNAATGVWLARLR